MIVCSISLWQYEILISSNVYSNIIILVKYVVQFIKLIFRIYASNIVSKLKYYNDKWFGICILMERQT